MVECSADAGRGAGVAGTRKHTKLAKCPVGVETDRLSDARVCSLGWLARLLLRDGMFTHRSPIENEGRQATTEARSAA